MDININNLFDFNDLGICIKTPKKEILFQNDACKSVCGDHTSQSCSLCSELTFQQKQNDFFSFSSHTSILFSEKQYILNQLCNLYKFEEKNKNEFTIISPLTKTDSAQRHYLKENGLTPREVEIALLMIDQKTNTEIQKSLTISKATLKTHLNHIYKKLPTLKSIRQDKIHNDDATQHALPSL